MAKTSLPPGFRFHPTDLELVWYYLKRKIMGEPFRFEAISEVELYKFAPWDLPDKSCLRSKDLEWYFFCPRDRKYSQGSRTNRATDIGYWKTTGKDRSIVHNTRTVGMKKTLIFYVGKAPQGSRTDWVMYEFRLESEELVNAGYTQDAYVICKIFQKSGPGPRNGEQYGAPFKEEDWEDDADVEDTGLFPSTSAGGHAHLFDPVIPQAVVAPEVGVTSSISSNFEVGEPSSMLSNVEVGEPSSVPEMSKIGEFSSMQGFPKVGKTSCIREPFWDDGILLDQLEAFLNSSPARPENANDEMFNSAILSDDATPVPGLDFEYIYDNLIDLSSQPLPEPTEGTSLCVTTGFDQELHPSLAEFANEDYVELNDIGFMGKWNPELVAPGDYGSYGLGNIFPDNVADHCTVSELQLARFADVQFPSTFEVFSDPAHPQAHYKFPPCKTVSGPLCQQDHSLP